MKNDVERDVQSSVPPDASPVSPTGGEQAAEVECGEGGSGLYGRTSRSRHARSYRPPRSVVDWGRIVVPSLAAGVGLTLSLPPFGFWILAFPAAALLWWRLGGLSWRRRLAAGWVAGLGQFVPALWWSFSFNVYGAVAMMLVEALAPAIACAATPPRRGRTLTLAGAMVLVEALRGSWPFGGVPLGGTALGQAGGPIAGAARVGGPDLLVGMVWLAGGGLGLLATKAVAAWRAGRGAPPESRVTPGSPGTTPRAGWRALAPGAAAGACCLLVVAGLAVWGATAPDGGIPVAHVRAAAVQGGGVRGLSKEQVDPATVYAAQVEATAEIPQVDGGRPPSLIVWPEDVVSLDEPLDVDPAKSALSEIAKANDATLVVGVTETISNTTYKNEIVAFSPSGRIVSRFEKVHRVPFGEYVPYRGFFKHLANLSGVPLDAVPGHGDGLMRTPAGPLGVMVSYEVFFAERGWLATRAGAQLLIVPTNTSSYATSQIPCQEVAAARLQAISEGRDLLQAAPTGFSSVVDNRGAVLERSPLGSRAVIVRDVALRSGRTVYGSVGDLPVLLGAGAMMLAGWLVSLLSRTGSETARRERL